MELEIKLQYASWKWGIDKWRKIDTNGKNKRKLEINKVSFLFLELGMSKVT